MGEVRARSAKDENARIGQTCQYFTVGVVVGNILNESVPESLEQYGDRKLFQPLGITRYQWKYTPQRVANTAGGLRMARARLRELRSALQERAGCGMDGM